MSMYAALKKRFIPRVPLTVVPLALAASHAAYGSDHKSNNTEESLPELSVISQKPSYVAPVSVGGKEAEDSREVPHSVSVITQQRIQDQNLTTIPEVLNQATGVTVIANDTTQSQMRSRGYSLGVMYDGIPATNALSGFQQFDTPMYERVDILKGPVGILTGSGDPGGVVNLVRKKAEEEFAFSGKVSAGSWSNYRSDLDITGKLNDSGTLRGRAVLSMTDRDYFYEKTHTDRWLGYGIIEFDLSPSTQLTFSAAAQNDHTDAGSYGLPAWSDGPLLEVSRKDNPIADWARSRWRTEEYTAQASHQTKNDWLLTARISHRPQTFFFKDGYVGSGVDTTTDTISYGRRERDYEYERNSIDLYATGPFELFGQTHSLLIGYNVENFSQSYEGVNADSITDILYGQSYLVPDFNLAYDRGGKTDVRQSGVYGRTKISLADPLTLVLGGRFSQYDSRSRTASPGTPSNWVKGAKADDEFTPYGAILWDLDSNWTVYASASDIFIPQTQERFDGSTLDPRSGLQTEVGLKAAFLDGQLNASLAWFRLRDTNRPYEDPDHVGYYLGRGEVESTGWEIELVGHPTPNWDIQAGYTLLDTEYTKDDSSEGEAFTTWEPRHTFKLWSMHHMRSGRFEGLSFGLGMNAMSESSAGTGSWGVRRQGGYAILSAMARYMINPNLSLTLNADNLTDRTYYTRLGGLNTYNTYGTPRNFTLSLNVDY